ncbi:thiamine pyrophosphate-dependent enzyme [Naumannella huperziae]
MIAATAPTIAGHAGRVAARRLAAEGVTRVFCVPGESYLPVLDGLHDEPGIEVVSARHEGGAAMMAVAHAKLTGTPGVCLVTRGPGATNASIGVHIAAQDAVPLVLLIGQVGTRELDREAFQEVDHRTVFGSLGRAAWQVEDPARLDEYLCRALTVACGDEPGPVCLALPQDVLFASVEAPAPRATTERWAPDVAGGALERVTDLLARSRRPVIIVGGSAWDDDARRGVVGWAERTGVPLVTSFRHQDLIDHTSPAFAGTLGSGAWPGLGDAVRSADLVCFIGTRPDAGSTGGETLLRPDPGQRTVHVHPSAGVLARHHRADVTVQCAGDRFAAALAGRELAADHRAWGAHLRAGYLAGLDEHLWWDRVSARDLIRTLSDELPDDAIISCGAGDYTQALHCYYSFRSYPSLLATQSGSMGFGLPAAIAAQLAAPGRLAVAIAGDGCFQMTAQELATAAQHRLSIIVVVINNERFGTIRRHQDDHFPGRVIATSLENPDFVSLALAHGGWGATVGSPDEFRGALREAMTRDGLCLIELRTTS